MQLVTRLPVGAIGARLGPQVLGDLKDHILKLILNMKFDVSFNWF